MSRGPWMEALDVQASLIDGLLRPGSGTQRATLGFEQTFPENERTKAQWVTPDGEAYDLTMAEWQAANLVNAETYWVSAEMLDVVEYAAESLDLTEPGAAEDLPVPEGFAFLERSAGSWDVRGRLTTFRAVSWTQVRGHYRGETWEPGGVVYTLWCDTQDMTDEINQDLHARGLYDRMRSLGANRYQISHVGQLPFGMNLAEWVRDARQIYDHSDDDKRPMVPLEERVALGSKQTAWLRTFWRLIEQRVGHPVEVRADRATARRLARTSPRTGDTVTVVTLRRFAEGDQPKVPTIGPDDGAPVAWSHRWMVRGHWRNQWYASLGRHRQIWIAPFVKGPEDQPLVLKPKVHRWTR